MHLSHLFYLIGFFLFVLSLALLPSVWVGFVDGAADGIIALATALGGIFVAGILILGNRLDTHPPLSIKEAFILTLIVWVVSICFGAIPLFAGSTDLSVTDALFQATSMMTTTGANLMPNLEGTSRAILLWCSVMQWLGGKGIILMAIMIMPILKVGGTQLLHTETSDKMEKFLPRATHMAMLIFWVYVALTLLCALILWGLGFSPFDALCHAMTTLSTGGFSTWDQSIQHANSLLVQGVITLFMFLGGTTFFVLALCVRAGLSFLWKDPQVRAYASTIFWITLIIALWRFYNSDHTADVVIVETLFNVTSALTTTGYVSADYSSWGGIALIIFFFLPFIGGCTGSTAGGIKIFRLQVLAKAGLAQLRKLRRPHGVFNVTYGGKPIGESVLLSVTSFFFLYILTFVGLSILLGLLNLDFLTSISGVASALTNLGPGLGDIIGPTGSYDGLPDLAKWILLFGMVLGRIELAAIFVLLMPSFWRR